MSSDQEPKIPGPLDGLTVIEMGTLIAGPFCGQILGDFGAEVIKIEDPAAGDPMRQWGRSLPKGHSPWWPVIGRNKKSVTLNLRTPEGQAIARKLIGGADVLVENFRPGALEKWGLGYDSLSADNPGLVMARVSGFGQTGPYAPRAGYDFMIQGMGGYMDLTGAPDGEPMKVGVAVADLFTGLHAVIGIQAALMARQVTGRGQLVDMSLLDTMVAMLANQGMNYLVSGKAPKRMGNAHPNIVPYQVFPVADGHIIIATGNDRQFRDTCAILGLEDIAFDPRFVHNAARIADRAELVEIMEARTKTFRRDDLLAQLAAAHVPAGPINSVADVFADPQVIARGLRLDLAHAGAAGGTVPSIRNPIVLSDTPLVHDHASPGLGADTDAVMMALGYDEDEVARLAAAGVVGRG